MAALLNGNADGKHCSKACVPELRFITAEVAVPNGTALIAALCSLHISMTLQHSASQWNASDQKHLLAALHNGNAAELRFITAEVAVLNGTALIAALYSLQVSMPLQDITPQWNASDQRIFFSTESIFAQHFTMATLMANVAATPVSLNSFFSSSQWHRLYRVSLQMYMCLFTGHEGDTSPNNISTRLNKQHRDITNQLFLPHFFGFCMYWPLRNPDMVFNQFRRFAAPLKVPLSNSLRNCTANGCLGVFLAKTLFT